jgi:MYXO-CTERM domain-containing protein
MPITRLAHSMRSPVVTAAAVLVATLATALATAPPARACGGFFCNQPQNPFDLPVAQTAENVLFAMERTAAGPFSLEAHVQIFYTGPADRFSWVVPVDSEPTLGVGSNTVFSVLLGTTQPRFSLNWTDVGTCLPSPHQPPVPSPSSGGLADSGAITIDGGRGGVDVAFRGDVGPYDAAVIKSQSTTDPKPLLDWLAREKYFVTPEGARLIEDYVRQDKWFVAIRLLSDKTTGEIQPLIMRFLGPGPCVPLKLTSIAAIRDLRVNLWVLAENRIVPDNFYEMEINPARIDWFKNGSNYEQLLKEAADQAGGQAFITEYAGPTQMLRNSLYQPGQYNLTGISTAVDPPTALNLIGQQGFPRDNTLLGILRTHIPMPDSIRAMGVQDRDFYNQLQFWWDSRKAEFKPLNAAALAADLDAKIIKPLQAAQALFDKHRKLTRLATFISPDEMNIDPTFVMNPSLPDIPATRTANAFRMCGNMEFNRCEAPVRIEVSSGEEVWFRPKPQTMCWGQAFDYERMGLDELPALYKGHARTSDGEGAARYDNSQMIRNQLVTRNALVMQERPLPDGGLGGAGDAGPDGPGGDGPTSTGGAGGSTATRPAGGGCGCSVPGTQPGLPAVAALLPLALLVFRRRRR